MGRGARSTSISRPSGPLKVQSSMSKSLGSPVQEECLGEKLVAHDAAEVQEETTSPIDEEKTRGVLRSWVLFLTQCCSMHDVGEIRGSRFD